MTAWLGAERNEMEKRSCSRSRDLCTEAGGGFAMSGLRSLARNAAMFAGLTLAATVQAAAPAEREVLPAGVEPTHYRLLIRPDATAMTFKGEVAVTIRVAATTRTVVLNSAGLGLDAMALEDGDGATAVEDIKLQRQTLTFAHPLSAGEHVLTIAYHGKIGHSTLGFFAMDYGSGADARRTLATNFEPSSARELLPCWDEPGRKATFSVSVEAPSDQMAVGNMPVANVTPLTNGRQRVSFAETPPMSTYLLFLAIGDFERAHRVVDGVDVGVVVKRGDLTKAAYALDQEALILHYYNEYFAVRFPLPKLDLVAAPGGIQGGSMENWGAIFYSQQHLLLDTEGATDRDRQLVFLVVAHETAHQWFGDLVTMAWWDNLWLNEGFARWMQTYAADVIHPEWKTGLQAQSIFEEGKSADAIPSTHPIVQTVSTADQASQAFDSITYDKGAAVITMLNAYVGPNAFRDGVRRYMRTHAYGNSVDADLWTEIQEAAGKPILAIEHDFTSQEGVPLVRVIATDGRARLSLGRFAADPTTIAGQPLPSWSLPLALLPLGASAHEGVILKTGVDIETSAPVLVNAGQTSYARVFYDEPDFSALTLKAGGLASVDQLGVLNDQNALGLAGYTPESRALAWIAALPTSAEPVVWGRAISLLISLDRRYGDTPGRATFRRHALALLDPPARRVGFVSRADDGEGVASLRGSLIEARAVFGDQAAIADARQAWIENRGEAEDRRVAETVAGETADPATFALMRARARSTTDTLDKARILKALAGARDPILAGRMIDIAFSAETPAGVAPSLLATLAENHPDLVWVQAVGRMQASPEFDKVTKWAAAVGIASGSARPERIADVEAYEEANVPPEARRPFVGAIASIRQNRRITEEILPKLDAWIADHPAER